MASSVLAAIGSWLAKNTLDAIISSATGPDVTAAESRQAILHFIEKKDALDSQRVMWGLLYRYNEIFKEANVLFYFKMISGYIHMGGVVANYSPHPNIHRFWEMIVGELIFTSELKERAPEVHPEVRALLKTQMILLIEYVGFERKTAVEMLETNWKDELRMDSNYYYGYYWETKCLFFAPRKFSIIFKNFGRIWDAAEGKWFVKIRQIYKEEIFDKAQHTALDPTPRELIFYFDPPAQYEATRIDARGDWFSEDAARSAKALWMKVESSFSEWPGWDEAKKYYDIFGISDLVNIYEFKVPLISK